MQKIINTIGLFTVGLLLITLITLTIGLLWETPNEGLIHNLCRYSTTAVVILGSIWTILFIYDELKR
jgi:ABC-type dipeptide/oligopeptide/nickel transport system permease component